MQASFLNHLAGESSPYLLQHAHNPVDWHPWNDEALNKAKQENKLMVISIGYAACHWCHVMEHESFEDPDVARIMNANYVSIKVDREERPDIDQVYMYASYAISSRGGWPLNVIALPDGRPVYAGTYFPKGNWISILEHFVKVFTGNRDELFALADEILLQTKKIDKPTGMGPGTTETPANMDELFGNWLPFLDMENGGSKGAPKFPMPTNLEFLLDHFYRTGNEKAEQAILLTLDKMAAGGIYDHLGGGFCRYSTDSQWHIPHFEKMLYDNAQLVSLYSMAFALFRKPRYKEIVYSAFEFIDRELTSENGLFFSSIDADSEGKEGAFYGWTSGEINSHLGEDAGIFSDYFGITKQGNWENGLNVLHVSGDESAIATKHGISGEELKSGISKSKEILFNIREKRVHPATDTKILTSWNALMISGYIDAYKSFGEQGFLDKAVRAATVLTEKYLREDGSLVRVWTGESRFINGFLDDYAFLISAFIDIYQVTFDEKWIDRAQMLMETSMKLFLNTTTGLFYYTSEQDQALIDRRMELNDNVIPSSNSQMAGNLFVLGHLLYRDEWIGHSEKMVKAMQQSIVQNPSYYSNWALILSSILHPPFDISVVGEDWEKITRELLSGYHPDIILSGGRDEGSMEILKGKLVPGKTRIYVCRGKTCFDPLNSVDEVIRLIFKE